MTLDNNNVVLTDVEPFFSLNTLPHISVGMSSCNSFSFFFSFDYFESFDHYAACWVTLMCLMCFILVKENAYKI